MKLYLCCLLLVTYFGAQVESSITALKYVTGQTLELCFFLLGCGGQIAIAPWIKTMPQNLVRPVTVDVVLRNARYNWSNWYDHDNSVTNQELQCLLADRQ